MLILVSGLGVSGCTSAHRVETVEERAVRDEAGVKAFEEAIQAFQRKDYGKAVAFFEALSEEATDERVARSALYGLAVTRLIVATTPEEFKNALNLWECWKRQVPEGVSGEDPRMFTSFSGDRDSAWGDGRAGPQGRKASQACRQSRHCDLQESPGE